MHATHQPDETDPHKTHSFDTVLDAEIRGMSHLREEIHRNNLIGLAFSGGGIRSATLNLGILQGMAKKGLLSKFDYLSTVSGGGYIGAWFSSLVKHSNHINIVQTELALSTQPHTQKDRQLTATEKAILWLRSYSNYLAPKTGLFSGDTLSALAQWIANTLLNQVLLLCLLIVLMMGVIFLSHSEIQNTQPTFLFDMELLWHLLLNACQTLSGKIGSILIAISMLISLYLSVQDCLSKAHAIYPIIVFNVGVCGLTIFLSTIPVESWNTILYTYPLKSQNNHITPNYWVGLGVPISSLLVSTFLVVLMGLGGRAIKDGTREWWHRIGGYNIHFCMLWLALFGFSLYLPYTLHKWFGDIGPLNKSMMGLGSWLFALLISRLGRSSITGTELPNSLKGNVTYLLPYIVVLLILLMSGYLSYMLYLSPNRLFWFTGAILIVAIGDIVLDINLFSLHNFYRYRLTRCYLGATNNERKPNRFTGFDNNDDLAMSALRWQRPTHIVNTAVNISDGSQLAWQQRKAASFMFSPYYCGFKLPDSEAWYETHYYTGEGGPQLGSLLSTSGAAASPNMGYHTNPVMGFIMTIFNARLGRWFGNPLQKRYLNQIYIRIGLIRRLLTPSEQKSPPYHLYYLIKELLTHTGPSSNFLYLSDGGHFENLGIYELVRRRCKLIVAIDAGADTGYEFEDLGNAIRKCKVDFGITLKLDISALLPVNDCKYGLFKCGTRHFAIGTIDYLGDGDPEHMGYLVYIKSSLTGDEPSDLINFKLQEPSFPHHSTVDQFFSESQFESYRRLGEHIAQNLKLPMGTADQAILSQIQHLMPGLITLQPAH